MKIIMVFLWVVVGAMISQFVEGFDYDAKPVWYRIIIIPFAPVLFIVGFIYLCITDIYDGIKANKVHAGAAKGQKGTDKK